MKRILKTMEESMAATVFGNVMSGRESKWYANPIGWLYQKLFVLIYFALIGVSGLSRLFYYVVVPLLVVCMFIQICRMNDQLDRIEAAQNTKTDTAIVIENTN